MNGVLIIRIAAYADLPPEEKVVDYTRVCHECPDAPCELDCLVPDPPFETRN